MYVHRKQRLTVPRAGTGQPSFALELWLEYAIFRYSRISMLS